MNDIIAINNTLPTSSFEAYIHGICRIPILTKEEEHTLAVQFKEKNDLRAARKLVLSNLRFVISVARRYLGYGLPFADLVQEGSVGLMKAIKKFDPNRKIRLISFAVHWIKLEIYEFILNNWRIVKIATTKEKRKLFFNLRKYKKKLNWLKHKDVNDIAKNLKVDAKLVYQMEGSLSKTDVSFDGSDVGSEKQFLAPENYLENSSADPLYLLEKADCLRIPVDSIGKSCITRSVIPVLPDHL